MSDAISAVKSDNGYGFKSYLKVLPTEILQNILTNPISSDIKHKSDYMNDFYIRKYVLDEIFKRDSVLSNMILIKNTISTEIENRENYLKAKYENIQRTN